MKSGYTKKINDVYIRKGRYNNHKFGVVIFENECKRILELSFVECLELKKIDLINSNIDSISYKSFFNCSNLETVLLNKNIENIDGRAFIGCDKLKEIKIPSTCKIINKFPEHIKIVIE